MEQRWNDTDMENVRIPEKNLFQSHFDHHKSQWTDLGVKPGRRGENSIVK
jgi:hypothetical protein